MSTIDKENYKNIILKCIVCKCETKSITICNHSLCYFCAFNNSNIEKDFNKLSLEEKKSQEISFLNNITTICPHCKTIFNLNTLNTNDE